MIELEVYVGDQGDWVLQIPNRDGTPATTFIATDTLAESVWEGQLQTAIVSRAVDWYLAVTDLTITAGGAGYSATPTVTISGGGASSDATAYAIVTAGVITSLVITDGGTGYTGTPAVVITDITGTGATATPTVTLGWQTGLVAAQLTAAESALLTPGGVYRFQVSATRGALTSVAIDCILKALATPGTTAPTPPDLITYDFAEGYCSVLGLSQAQRDQLPYIVAAASMATRRFCQDRNFDLRTYTEFYTPIQGVIRLLQPPVQIVKRVQAQPQLALTIQNTSSAVQAAQAYFGYSGTWQGYSTAAQTPTGMVLNSVSSGVVTTSTVTFTANETIAGLATAINLVGGGWTASADSTYGAWPVTELDGGYVGQGCASGAVPSQGAQFSILLDLALNGWRLDNLRNGFIAVGRQDTAAYQWGPGGDALFNNGPWCGRVKVTYIAGETVIPMQVQLAVAEWIKTTLYSMKTDWTLESETAQEYSYKLCFKMLGAIPPQVAQALAPYIIQRA